MHAHKQSFSVSQTSKLHYTTSRIKCFSVMWSMDSQIVPIHPKLTIPIFPCSLGANDWDYFYSQSFFEQSIHALR